MRMITSAIRNEQQNVMVVKVESITDHTLSFYQFDYKTNEEASSVCAGLQEYLILGEANGVEYKEITGEEVDAIVKNDEGTWMLTNFFGE